MNDYLKYLLGSNKVFTQQYYNKFTNFFFYNMIKVPIQHSYFTQYE